jgi:hypothetical protein
MIKFFYFDIYPVGIRLALLRLLLRFTFTHRLLSKVWSLIKDSSSNTTSLTPFSQNRLEKNLIIEIQEIGI